MRRVLCAALLLLTLSSGGCLSRNKDLTAIPKGKDRDLTVDQLMAKGKGLLERRKYFRSRTTLEIVQSRQEATREILADVNLLIADAYFFDGGIINLAEALSRYTSFLTFYPTHSRADYAQYQLGLSYLKQALSPDKDQAITIKVLTLKALINPGQSSIQKLVFINKTVSIDIEAIKNPVKISMAMSYRFAIMSCRTNISCSNRSVGSDIIFLGSSGRQDSRTQEYGST